MESTTNPILILERVEECPLCESRLRLRVMTIHRCSSATCGARFKLDGSKWQQIVNGGTIVANFPVQYHEVNAIQKTRQKPKPIPLPQTPKPTKSELIKQIRREFDAFGQPLAHLADGEIENEIVPFVQDAMKSGLTSHEAINALLVIGAADRE